MTDRDYQHSRPLDVHRWSEHREINNLVNLVFEKFISRKAKENKTIRKKHLKVVLLDLYVAWLNDPDLNIASRDLLMSLENTLRVLRDTLLYRSFFHVFSIRGIYNS